MTPLSSEERRERFLSGMSHAACSVNVVTTDGRAGRFGVTVSAMASVSADTPLPTLLVCINQSSPVARAVLENGVFCVNLLRDDQIQISDVFAGRAKHRGADRFQCATWTTQATGAPRVVDPLVAFDCSVTASELIGSHYVVFGSVRDIFIGNAGSPLIYANRAYGTPQHFPPLGDCSFDAADGRTFAVGCFHTFGPYLLPELLERLDRRCGGFPIRIIESDQRGLLDSLRRGEIEVALLYDFGLEDRFHVVPLAELTPYVLLPERHPLAARAALDLEELTAEPLVLLDVDPSRQYFLDLFLRRGLHPKRGLSASSVEMVRGLVAHGLGYSLLATKPANNMSYDGRSLACRPLAASVPCSRLGLASRRGSVLTKAGEAFMAECLSFFGRQPLEGHQRIT